MGFMDANQYQTERRTRLRAEGKCYQCGAARFEHETRCLGCIMYHRDRAHQQYAKGIPKKHNESRRARGKCIVCENPNYNGTLRCLEHTMLNRLRASQWYKANPQARVADDHRRRTLIALGRCRCNKDWCKPRRKACAGCLAKARAKNATETYWMHVQRRAERGDFDVV